MVSLIRFSVVLLLVLHPIHLIGIMYFFPLSHVCVFDLGLFDEQGRLIGSASSPIQIWKEKDCIEVAKLNVLHFSFGRRHDYY